jgi:hypothetical protein
MRRHDDLVKRRVGERPLLHKHLNPMDSRLPRVRQPWIHGCRVMSFPQSVEYERLFRSSQIRSSASVVSLVLP